MIADWSAGGAVTVAMARGLSSRIDRNARLCTVAPGSEVDEGDAVAVLHTANGSFAIGSPAAGRVSAINPEAVLDPFLATVDPSEGGWLVELRPERLLLDECPLVWGRRGREQYEAFAARVGSERMLDEVRLASHVAGVRMSCARGRGRVDARAPPAAGAPRFRAPSGRLTATLDLGADSGELPSGRSRWRSPIRIGEAGEVRLA